MCNTRNSKSVQVIDLDIAMISCASNYKTVRVDKCMAQIIHFLNYRGIRTLACCCGHGRYPMTIVVSGNMLGDPVEIFTGEHISRKRKFYRLDEKGYYYIPEVSNAKC